MEPVAPSATMILSFIQLCSASRLLISDLRRSPLGS
jgi:hypothetical protein